MKGKLVVEKNDKLLESRLLADAIKSSEQKGVRVAGFCTNCYGMPCISCIATYQPQGNKKNERNQ